jgi:hypothetical protein
MLRLLRTFRTHLLIHMQQKEKIALEIAEIIASVNGPIYTSNLKCIKITLTTNYHFHIELWYNLLNTKFEPFFTTLLLNVSYSTYIAMKHQTHKMC